MAKKTTKRRIFNLLKPLEPPKTYWDKIYEWVTSKAKSILIVIEILIVAVFFVKVIVDNTNKNLRQEYEKIKTEVDVESSQNEALFRKYQQKELEYRKLWDYSANYTIILDEIYSFLNSDAEVSVLIENNKVTINGYLPITESKLLEDQVKNSAMFQNVYADLTVEAQDVESFRGQFIITADVTKEYAIRAKFIPELKNL